MTMTNAATVEATGMAFLSDRWGDPLGELDVSDAAAVERLGGIAADCEEFGFVARDVDGRHGVRVEYEFVWHASDDDEMVEWSWGDLDDAQILAAVTGWVDAVNVRAAHLGVDPGVVVTGEEMFAGRLGACWFIPEDNADVVLAFVAELGATEGPTGTPTSG